MGLVYMVGLQTWAQDMFKHLGCVHPIHTLMLLLAVSKAATLLLESAVHFSLNGIGSAGGWDVAYCISTFFQSSLFYLTYLLIASGSSHMKRFLRRWQIVTLLVLLPIQVCLFFGGSGNGTMLLRTTCTQSDVVSPGQSPETYKNISWYTIGHKMVLHTLLQESGWCFVYTGNAHVASAKRSCLLTDAQEVYTAAAINVWNGMGRLYSGVLIVNDADIPVLHMHGVIARTSKGL